MSDTSLPARAESNESQMGLSRRSALALAGFAAAASGLAAAPAHAGGEHDAHAHHNHKAKHQALIDAALECVNRGEVCVDHCLMTLADGDTSLKDCIRSVSAMLPMCTTLARLGALDAKRLKDFAEVCRDVCADCEDECKKHADKHTACKACADSCAACIKQCKAVIEG